MLSTWISLDDLERLVVSALTAPIVGHTIIFGMSDNQTSWWDNTHAKHIGYRALDSSDVFRHEVEARQPHIDRHDKAALFQGGAFVKIAPHVE
jgi:uronate dehydrogenase